MTDPIISRWRSLESWQREEWAERAGLIRVSSFRRDLPWDPPKDWLPRLCETLQAELDRDAQIAGRRVKDAEAAYGRAESELIRARAAYECALKASSYGRLAQTVSDNQRGET